jgi:uncharacterized protein (TIGR02647 family)
VAIRSEFIEELHLLSLFNLDSIQEGIKIHHEAGADKIAAAERLFQKGIITQIDGGYLTNLGIEAAEHAHALINILMLVEH